MSQKIKKKSTFIDMTAMSDVTVLLLTFFMLTSTFIEVLKKMGESYQIEFSDQELKKFSLCNSFGVPIQGMKQFLALSSEEQDKVIMNYGIPCDSTNNQFKSWMQFAREVNKDLVIAIKADQKTPYPLIKDIMATLQDLRENRYNLITSLRNMPEV